MTIPNTLPDAGLAIEEFERRFVGDAAETAAFLEGHTFPLVEGSFCTFVYQGSADDVRLRHWIYGLPSSQPFRRFAHSDLWALTLELPENSRFEYKIEVHHGDQAQLLRDPLNPLTAHDPFGANSVCHANGYHTPAWTQPDPSARPGTLERRTFHSHALGETQSINVYLPARYRATRRYPLLIVHDGLDYVRFAALTTILDNLVHRLEIPAMIVALIDPSRRLDDYTASDAHSRFLHDELVPQLEREFPLVGTPDARGLMGASLGAVAAFHTAARYPDAFGNLLLQSGSFAFTDIGDHERGPLFDDIVAFMNAYRRRPVPVSRRVFVSCGTYESLIYENRSLVPVLQRAGMEVRYEEARDGHNWENWRDRLRVGLSWLFPGPLWMVYE